MILLLASLLLGALAVPQDRSDFEMMEFSTNLDNPMYRLTDAVQPREVHVDLNVYLSEARFDGHVQLNVEVRL
jgi:hypothetical protein